MALFYQINFTSERHARVNTARVCIVFLLVCLVAGAAGFMWYLYGESKKPVLGPRLSTYQTHLAQVTQTLADWRQAEAGWQEVRAYVEQEGQLAPADMLRSLEGLAQMGAQPSPDPKCPHAFFPERLEVLRAGGLVLTGEAWLPEREKVAHCTRLAGLVTECVTNTLATVTNTVTAEIVPLAPQTFTFEWSKAEPGRDDVRLKATLKASFAGGKPLVFKTPPPELDGLLAEAQKWHAKVIKCSLEYKSGKKETIEALLSRVLSDNRQALGDRYEHIKALSETAVNPMVVSREIRKALDDKVSASLADFERAWSARAQERWPWRREKELDNPELDAAVANMGAWLEGGVLPRKQAFEAIQSRNLAYLYAMTNGVQSKHAVEEDTFWKIVLRPSLTVRKELVPSETLKVVLDAKDKASRVAFPLWRVSLGELKEAPKTAADSGEGLTFADLEKVLMNVETNPAGMWVTAVTVDFDKAQADPKSRWEKLSKVSVEGRVPCWVGAGAPLKP